MNGKIVAVVGSAALGTALAITGCGPTNTTASVKASASTLQSNPAIQHDEKVAEGDLTSCAASTQILLHPHKNKPVFETCLKGKGLNPQRVDTCIKSLSLASGTGAAVTFATCVVRKK